MRYVMIAIGTFFAILFLSSTAYVVDQRKYAVVFGMGEIKEIIAEPGLNFKLPAPLQNVALLDKRVMTTSATEPDRMATADRTAVQVDSFVNWRIVDPRLFFTSFNGDDQRAQERMMQVVKSALSDEISKRTIGELLSGNRTAMMTAAQKKVADDAGKFGVEIVDVRIRRLDFADQMNSTVFERMKTERMRLANEQRATGAAELEKIKADADRQRMVILAEAYRDAEKIRGDGDSKAARTYAQAFGQNPEFYKFYRSLEAYKASFANRSDVMVVDPSSEFFRYFKNSKGAGGK